MLQADEARHQAIHGGGNWRLGRKWEGEWNRRVMSDIRNAEADVGRKLTKEEILRIVRRTMRQYGINGPFVPYHGD